MVPPMAVDWRSIFYSHPFNSVGDDWSPFVPPENYVIHEDLLKKQQQITRVRKGEVASCFVTFTYKCETVHVQVRGGPVSWICRYSWAPIKILCGTSRKWIQMKLNGSQILYFATLFRFAHRLRCFFKLLSLMWVLFSFFRNCWILSKRKGLIVAWGMQKQNFVPFIFI